MAEPGVYFAIYYDVPDRAFERAADTWQFEVTGGVCSPDVLFLSEKVSTEADFKRAWMSIHLQASQAGQPVRQGQLFTHASKGSANDGLEFKGGGGEDGTLAQGEIGALAQMNWAEDGQLILSGCNTGLTGARGWNPGQVFATNQQVVTVGQAGYGYFSTSRDTYLTINDSSPIVYLWAYRRGQNGAFGGGGRMAGVVFNP
jgi:hypothetical protein